MLADDRNGTRRTIVWDEDNRIQSIADNGHTETYKYDDAGRRVIKRGPQGETVYVNPYFTVRNRSVATNAPFDREPFAAGRVYYRPHHHYHATYNLPVVVNHRVAYRPYNYCRGRVFVRPGTPLPHLAVNVVFGDRYDYERYFAEERNRYFDDDDDERYQDGDRYYYDDPGSRH